MKIKSTDTDFVDNTTTPPTAGQALVWDDVDSKYKPGDVAASGGGGGSSDLVVEHTFDGVETSWDSGTLPTGYDSVRIEIVGRSQASAGYEDWNLRFNGDSGANYIRQNLQAYNTSTAAGLVTAETAAILTLTGATSAANLFANWKLDVLGHEDTTAYKATIGESVRHNGTYYFRQMIGHVWQSTAAITSVQFSGPTALVAGSKIRVILRKTPTTAGSGASSLIRPAAADFTLRGTLPGLTLTDLDTGDGVRISWNPATARQNAAYLKDAPATPFEFISEAAIVWGTPDIYWWFGPCIGDTSAEELVGAIFRVIGSSIVEPRLHPAKISGFTTTELGLTTTYDAPAFAGTNALTIRVKIICDGTDVHIYASPDRGDSWVHINSEPESFFTNGPTKLGFWMGHVASSSSTYCICTHFEVNPL